MKNRKLLALLASICLVLVLAALPFMAACAAPAPAPAPTPTPTPTPTPVPTPPAEPIVLKAISFIPVTNSGCDGFREYAKRVNEAAKGELIIDWIGGPEIIAGFDQDEAIRTGVFDMAMLSPTYVGRSVPASLTLVMSPLSNTEEREVGYYDFLVEQHEKANLRFLTRCAVGKHYYFFTNIKVDRPQELAGQRIRSSYPYFVDALGCASISIPMRDNYTAMDQGIIDGWLGSGKVVGKSWHEVVDYMILPGLYLRSGTVALNLGRWNNLPTHLQKVLLDVGRDMEPWLWEKKAVEDAADIQTNIEHGLKIIEFTGEDAKWYVDLAYSSRWDDMAKTTPAEDIAKVKAMFGLK